jgi:hypothetical protein
VPRRGTGTKTNWPTDRRSQWKFKLNLSHCTENYRPVLSSERAPYTKNKENNCHSNKCNIWSPAPKGTRHQDELADWQSFVMWLRLRLPGAPEWRLVRITHRSHASRKRRRKGIPIPWGITRPPCSCSTYLLGPELPGWRSLVWDSKIWSEFYDCFGKAQKQFYE